MIAIDVNKLRLLAIKNESGDSLVSIKAHEDLGEEEVLAHFLSVAATGIRLLAPATLIDDVKSEEMDKLAVSAAVGVMIITDALIDAFGSTDINQSTDKEEDD